MAWPSILDCSFYIVCLSHFLVIEYKDEEMTFICRNSNSSRADRNVKNLLTPVGGMHKVCGNTEEEAAEDLYRIRQILQDLQFHSQLFEHYFGP